MEQIARDFRNVELPDSERALLEYAETLTLAPAAVGRAEVDALRSLGWSDRAISDAIQVTAYFNYVNRVAEGVGVDLEPEMPPARPR